MLDLSTLAWRKSSYSNGGGNCVETAALDGATWRKSSYSNGGGECVETAALDEAMVAVRDSKNPAGGVLFFPRTALNSWLSTLT
ncbi:uncharacterized protein DUF397 [Tamaricihabitans halophyticus]|uniref:Uncharacterized protein DUF397 n=1 Tax=Tamaricihabitans halophyticus TaxID=1262583 RepID=A0A4R2R5Q7_9PSEU|nr:DUF397 domain-containing protein [Tamaricihabitans halophyticus]TCP57357.1 uncharacterized protein DUF397 [Tamaricihabitans halophyticus]